MLYNRAGATRTYKPEHIDIANCVRHYAPHYKEECEDAGRSLRPKLCIKRYKEEHGDAGRSLSATLCFTRYKEELGDAGRSMSATLCFTHATKMNTETQEG